MNVPTFLLFLGAITSVVAVPGAPHRINTCPTVDLGYEIHQASYNETGQYYNFTNIRYGAPPLGDLRFAAPVPPSHTKKVFNDGSRVQICPTAIPAWYPITTEFLTVGLSAENLTAGYQMPNITSATQDPRANEDCLFLDLLVPRNVFEKAGKWGYSGAPVMVWIHGGGYTLGYKTQWGGGAGLIAATQANGKEGVIFIAIDYRVGVFGFLAGPTFQAQHGTANAGLLDQRLALEWVQQNIHLFGGDPNRVTVVGESAGGGSTLHQITAYGGARGEVPFQQAIVQSGAFEMLSSDMSEATYQKFLATTGVADLHAARQLSTEELQLANAIIVGESPYGMFTFNPTVDGTFVPALPGQLLLEGRYDKSLKLLIGHNADEGLDFINPYILYEPQFTTYLQTFFPDASPSTISYIQNTLYPPIFDGSQGYTNQWFRSDKFVSEAFFSCNADYLSRAFEKQAHAYFFTVPPALHGDDIYYTFYNGPSPLVKNDTLALIMQAYFTNFVEAGDPNGKGLPAFPANGGTGTVLNLNLSTIGVTPDPVANPRCAWWQRGLFQ